MLIDDLLTWEDGSKEEKEGGRVGRPKNLYVQPLDMNCGAGVNAGR